MSLGERAMGDKFKAGVELRTKRAMTRASLAWTKWSWKNVSSSFSLQPATLQQ
jgi:hypothetical protein